MPCACIFNLFPDDTELPLETTWLFCSDFWDWLSTCFALLLFYTTAFVIANAAKTIVSMRINVNDASNVYLLILVNYITTIQYVLDI